MMFWRFWIVGLVPVLFVGCFSGTLKEGSEETGQAKTHANADIVARVNGVAISGRDVVYELNAGGHTSLSEALDAIIRRELLVFETRRLKRKTTNRIRWISDRAAAQKILSEKVEALHTSSQLLLSDVQAAYQTQRTTFNKPERRASMHVLARLDPSASPELNATAEVFVEGVVKEMLEASDPKKVVERYKKMDKSLFQFQIIAEEVPALERTADAELAYLDALYALSGLGVVPKAIRTGYGWHAMILTRIDDAVFVPFEKVESALRADVVKVRRKDEMAKLIAQLKQQIMVQADDAVLKVAMETDISSAGHGTY